MKITGLLEKNIFKVVTLKKFVIPNKVDIFKEIPNNTQKYYPVI